MRRLAVISLVAALAFTDPLSRAALAGEEEFQKLVDEANAHWDKEELNQALECFEKALVENPKSAATLLNIALVQKTLGKADDQLAALKKVIEVESPQGRYSSMACDEIGIWWGERAVKGLNEGHPETYRELMDRSLDFFRKGIKFDERNEHLWSNFGVSCMIEGDAARHANDEATAQKHYREAVSCFKESLKWNPDQPKVQARLGFAQGELKQDPAGTEPPPAPPPAEKPPPPGGVEKTFDLPALGGWAQAPDQRTIIVSLPTKAELVLLDVLARCEVKRYKVDFQPGRLAVSGNRLVSSARGASVLYVLDVDSGKVQKEIKVSGDTIAELACHPTRGRVYATTTNGEVLSIDISSGNVFRTVARGTFLAVDQVTGQTVYTCGYGQDEKRKDPVRSPLRKYAVSGKDLKLVATNENAASRARGVGVSPDGKRVTVVGEDGWRPASGPQDGPIVLSFYGTDDLATSIGTLEAGGKPEAIAIHPVLNLGALKTDKEVVHFQAKSLVQVRSQPLEGGGGGRDPGWIAFAGRGTKVVAWQPGNFAKKEDGKLTIVGLDLSQEEKDALEKAYARLKQRS